MSVNINSVICKTDNFVASELDDGLVMMSLENNSYYGLDEIGKKILQLSDNPVKVNQIIDILLNDYEITSEECEKDVISLLEQMEKEGVITIA